MDIPQSNIKVYSVHDSQSATVPVQVMIPDFIYRMVDVSELEALKQIQEDAALRLFENDATHAKHPTCQHSMFVLEEEVQELKDEFHKKDSSWDYSDIYDEALDVIASCYRLIIDNAIISKAKHTNEG